MCVFGLESSFDGSSLCTIVSGPIKDCCTAERERVMATTTSSPSTMNTSKVKRREMWEREVLFLLFYFAFSIIIITCFGIALACNFQVVCAFEAARSFRPDESLSLACWPAQREYIYSKHSNYLIYYIRLSQLLMAFLLVNNDQVTVRYATSHHYYHKFLSLKSLYH